MPFISDPIGDRTHDPDRNIELVKRYSQLTGSSGYQEYAIEWPGGGFGFFAKMATGDDAPAPDPDGTEHICWLIYSNGVLRDQGRVDTRLLIVEAMTAYRSLFGLPASGPRYSVVFE